MKKKIFIVDDDKTILEAIKILLEDEGYDVDLISSGTDLFKKIGEEIPSLILLDFRLPGQDGLEIAKKIKASKKTIKTPIIMVSADNNVRKTAGKVVDAFLAKPFDINTMLSMIEKYC